MHGITKTEVSIYFDEVQGAVCSHLVKSPGEKLRIATIYIGVILKMAEMDPGIFAAYPPDASLPFLKFMRAIKGTREYMRLCDCCVRRLASGT